MHTATFQGEARRLLSIASPLWAAQVASVALPLTDALYMGHLGALPLAGGGLAATLLASAILVGGSALGGLSPRVAKAYAQTDRDRVALLVRHARWLAAAIAGLVILLALAGEPLLLLGGQETSVADAARSYLLPAAWSVPLTLGCSIHRSVLAACGRARLVTYAWALAVPLNLGLDHSMALGVGPIPALGLGGVGASTSFVSLAVFLFLTAAARTAKLERVDYWLGRSSWPVMRDLLSLGLPIVVAVGAEAGVFALAGVAIGWFGADALAAHRVATMVAFFAFLGPLAIAQAAAIRVAAATGNAVSSRPLRARVPLLVAASWAAVVAPALIAAAPLVVSWFIAREHPSFALAVSLVYVVAAFQVADALQVVAAGVLRGTGDTVTAMRWSLVAYGLVAPAIAITLASGAGLGTMGVWIGLAVGLVVACLALIPAALRATRA